MVDLEIIGDLRSTPPDLAGEFLGRWATEDGARLLVHRATFAVPVDTPVPTTIPAGWRVVSGPLSPGFWSAVLAAAGNDSRPVLALLAPVAPGLEAAGLLLDLLASDEMFGATVPRLQCARGCCVRMLREDGQAAAWMPREVIGELPAHEIVDDPSACALLLRPTLLTEFREAESPFTSLVGTLRHRLAAARRCGFRTVLANRAVMTAPAMDCTAPCPPPAAITPVDAERLAPFEIDAGRGWREFRGLSTALFEQLASRHLRALRGECRPSLLLDMRNVGAGYNGTSFAAIGTARGLHGAGIDWDIAILANAAGAAFHDFAGAFPGWTIHTSLPDAAFNVALRLSQPWHIQEMVDLHRVARLNAYLILDTISWDVVYVAPAHLDGTWQFLTASADSLFFISEFSRQRFCGRFPHTGRTQDVVCHLSFEPGDYVRPEFLDQPASDYVLVIGNHLEHKDVTATVDLLASAFPTIRIETLGPVRCRSSRVRSHESGTLAELDVQQLYAHAKIAVFPSFYEGFGLPVVTSLAYGRTLLARESSLLTEIAARCPPRGRLVLFRQRDELVDRIGRLLHGEPVPEHPLGTALNGRPRSWTDAGRQIEQALRQLMASAAPAQWRARNELISQVSAYRI